MYCIVLRGEIFIEGRIYNRVLEGRGLLPVNIRQGIVFPGIAVRGENLMGERIYNGVGGSLIVGANYFSAPGGLLPLKSRRGRDCHGKYSPRGRNFTDKYSPRETFLGGDPIIVHRQ